MLSAALRRRRTRKRLVAAGSRQEGVLGRAGMPELLHIRTNIKAHALMKGRVARPAQFSRAAETER